MIGFLRAGKKRVLWQINSQCREIVSGAHTAHFVHQNAAHPVQRAMRFIKPTEGMYAKKR